MAQIIKAVKIEYDLNKEGWKATILAVDGEDAVQTLIESVKNPTIKTISNEGQIHDISKKALDIIKKSKNISDDQKENIKIEEKKYICAWCDKQYDDPKYLKIHLTKAHNVKEQKQV